ncbi:MAG: hypothetical protein DIZ80_11070 [endosymbiont of Galathealinum brachiosum]|uniref:histidine kinase n=1 Tax=endosymbiont of Galathealinum brachiosum TaxID=2200906 RepID=A0A370DES3_9GAMM|nr:MAG: hypothetical protein DIZ80_11070 [endosymbiont of Galathealinum brachiosum]
MTMFQQYMFNKPNIYRVTTSTRFEFINLGLMLLLLHLALHQPTENSPLVSALLLAHIGFFLLWQPALNATEEIHLKTLIPVLLLNIALYLLLGDWFIALWIILLIGLTSGSALVNGFQRTLYALSAVILFLQLSLILTPRLFHLNVLDHELEQIIFYVLLFACALLILWPCKKVRSVKIDYLHSILISFGLFSFYVTSILISFTSNIHYLQSLLITALSIGVFFIILSLIWLPRHGLAGIGQIWEQHILNIGNPFENWVKHTSLLGQNKKITPDLYLENSIKQLLTLSWVSGVKWSDNKSENLYGEVSAQQTLFEDNGIRMILYSHIPMGSALKIHAQLLMHLMSYFYNSKLREITLKNQTHLKAVYETGSKLTHDIKNILQSLQALTGVVHAADDPAESHQLISKQLPILSQRLQNTLDKLQTKTDTGKSFKQMDVWWTELQSRYHGRDIQFVGETDQNTSIDTDVFDTVLENLLENARNKRRTRPETEITTTIKLEKGQPVITVYDDGDPVPVSKTNVLFKQILPSKDGYGIGLYQSAQLAERNGYQLQLIHNEPSNVCFQLSSSKI